MPNKIRSRYIQFDGYKTHYSESGDDSPVLVALHGGGAGSSGEAGMSELMERFPQDIRFVAPDSVGGFGLTDPHAPAPLGLQSRVDHFEHFADALCLDRFTLLGNSQGAWVAARYAILHPERVERLILIGSLTLGLAMGFEEEMTPGMIALRGYDGSEKSMRTMLEGLVCDRSKITDELVGRRLASATRPGAYEAITAALRATRRLQTEPLMRPYFDMKEWLPQVTRTIPTIVIWGEQDTFALPSIGRRLEPLLPDVAFHWIPEAGHQVQNDQPEVVTKIVLGFMGRAV